jgi:hypothetical protein
MLKNRVHPRTEAEKDQRASQLLRELEQQYGEANLTLDEARARTAMLTAEMSEIVN